MPTPLFPSVFDAWTETLPRVCSGETGETRMPRAQSLEDRPGRGRSKEPSGEEARVGKPCEVSFHARNATAPRASTKGLGDTPPGSEVLELSPLLSTPALSRLPGSATVRPCFRRGIRTRPNPPRSCNVSPHCLRTSAGGPAAPPAPPTRYSRPRRRFRVNSFKLRLLRFNRFLLTAAWRPS